MQQPGWYAALIGDVVGSRDVPDRAGLQDQMGAVFAEIDDRVGGDPAFTIGDEFQARFADLDRAIAASLEFHLRTWGIVSLRIGIGWGELLTEDPTRTPYGQDGPCWWRAREAVETVEKSGRGRGPRLRTAIRTGTGSDRMLNGYLMLRDTIVSGFDGADARVALGLMEGRSQSDLALELGVNRSSVSRRVRSHGILAVVETREPAVPGPSP